MKRFIFNTQPLPPFLLPSSTSQFYSILLYLSHPPPVIVFFSPLPRNPLAFPHPVISLSLFFLTLSLPHYVCFWCILAEKVLPEGTVAGLKGANSSVGGCRPCEGSSVLAGEAGVCAGGDWKSVRGKTRQ